MFISGNDWKELKISMCWPWYYFKGPAAITYLVLSYAFKKSQYYFFWEMMIATL